ncbi:CUB and sushi domain-containing protein 1-like [Lineus longissimus]|uniref:CUB and sushi domain-containing protein 1-like n=1 Tax=Lineus longissimus TaxID=88925 RepID=UPI002B4E595F
MAFPLPKMVIFFVALVAFVITVEGYVEVKTPRDTPYTVKNPVFYYLTGNYTVGTQQKFGTFQVLEVNLHQETWLLLYTKPEANKISQPYCDDNPQDIPQERIMRIYNNHTVKVSSDAPDQWTIVNNTIVCFQILQKASVGKWGTFKYKYEDSCSKLVVQETRLLSSSKSKSLTVRTHHECYPLKSGYSTVIDFQMTLKNATSLDRVLMTKQNIVNERVCKYVRRFESYYGNRNVQECKDTPKIKSETLQMITGQTPDKHLLQQWPLVLTGGSHVCFEFDAVQETVFKDDMLFRISEFPECTGVVSNRSGILVSPGYPLTPYANNTNCTWTIKVRPGERILAKFGDTKSDCGNDYLMMSDVEGGSKNMELLCGGSVTGRSFISVSNQLKLRFQTSNFTNLKGFLMNYTVIGCSLERLSLPDNSMMLNKPKDYIPQGFGLRIGCKQGYVFPSKVAEVKLECLPDSTWFGNIPFCIGYTVCNETLTAPEGFVTSPGYPHSYPKDARCSWTIRAKEGQRILIKVEDFKSSCMNDYVVLDGVEQTVIPTTVSSTTTTTAAPARSGNTASPGNTAATGTRSKRSASSRKEYICGKSVSAGKEYTSADHTLVITFRSYIFEEIGYLNMSYKALGCSGKDLRKPLNVLLRNPDTYYPENYRLVVGCNPGFSFPGGFNSIVVVCGKKGAWAGRVPLCVRWKTGL